MDLIRMSAAASVLIAFVIALRVTIGGRLTKTGFVILWKIALLRLIVPLSVPAAFGGYALFDGASAGLLRRGTEFAESDAGLLWARPVTAIWAAGAAALALGFAIAFYKSWRELGTALPIKGNALIDAWLREQTTWRPIRVLVSDRIATPMTYGIVKPAIVLPKGMNFGNDTQLRYILAHELVHIRRFDALWKLLAIAALCLHWVNPLVWLLYMFMNRDMEMSCDEKVIRRFGHRAKSGYARSIIEMAERKMRFAPLFSSFGKHVTEERILSIMKWKKMSFPGLAAACLLAAIASTVFIGGERAAVQAAADVGVETILPDDGKRTVWMFRREVIDGSGKELKIFIKVEEFRLSFS